jgi:hypothetical protein
MGLFQRKENWERTFRLRSNQGSGRGVLTVFFWGWGLIGLLQRWHIDEPHRLGWHGHISLLGCNRPCLDWRMMLFGFGALVAHNDFDGERQIEEDHGDVRVTR